VNGDLFLLRRLGERADERVLDLLIRGLIKVRNKKRALVLLQPNRAQQEYARNCSRRNIVLKARQMGMTTYVAARFFIQTITQPGTLTVQVAHSQESAEEIFKIVRRFWENLPKAMQRGALATSRSNVRQLVFPRLDSEYRVATAADPNAGRGMTIHHLHCSEVARWPRDGEETLASLRAAVADEGEIVLESTPNGAGGVFYDEWQRAEETGYTRHFFPWWWEEAYRMEGAGSQRGTQGPRSTPPRSNSEFAQGRLSTRAKSALARDDRFEEIRVGQECPTHTMSDEERELLERYGLSFEQIAWRRVNRAQLRGMAAQEYAEDPVSCFRASGECVFEMEAIERALAGAGEAAEMRDNKRLQIWLPAQAGKRYIVGVDPAGGGTEGDYSCAQVIERETGMQCAELHGHFPPRELAGKLIELRNLYNRGLLVVERNNHGYGVLAHLRAAGAVNVYQENGQDGWLTSAVSRPAMIENLGAVLSAQPELFRSLRLLHECRTFVRQADGSSGAAGGTHDDCVMAMAMALEARRKTAGRVARVGMMEMASLAGESRLANWDVQASQRGGWTA
jgi:Terminase RNaseH-like domain